METAGLTGSARRLFTAGEGEEGSDETCPLAARSGAGVWLQPEPGGRHQDIKYNRIVQSEHTWIVILII